MESSFGYVDKQTDTTKKLVPVDSEKFICLFPNENLIRSIILFSQYAKRTVIFDVNCLLN